MSSRRSTASLVSVCEREKEKKKEIKAQVSGFPLSRKDQLLVLNLEKRLKTAGKERSEAGI